MRAGPGQDSATGTARARLYRSWGVIGRGRGARSAPRDSPAPVRSLVRGSLTLAAHRGETLFEAGFLEDGLDLLDDLLRGVEVAEAELFADLEQVLHVGGPLLAPGLADGGEHEVRVAAHALVVEG